MPTYTIAQVAKEFQVSVATVKRWIKAGKIKALPLGHRTVRITQEEVDRIKKQGLRK